MTKTFKQLGLSESFIAVLEKLKIMIPTEVQEKTIPLVLSKKDIVASAATGSGKTLAFVSGIIENLEATGKSRVLVLTPTRELAEQIASNFRKFAIKKLKVFALYGGVRIDEQIKKIKDADIVIATPGRLLDMINRQAFNLKEIEILILDEFDRMLDMGFSPDVDLIVGKCPKERQTMLFSATKVGEIEEQIEKYTINAKIIEVKAHIDPSKLKQIYYSVPKKEKFSLFYDLIQKEKSGKAMVFCSTQLNTEFIGNKLEELGIDVEVIHGGLDQKKRTNRLKRFHKEGGVLVCTDVASRGLDIKGITHIYNYNLPRKPEDYIHRIGRTARAGKQGIAVTILSPEDAVSFKKISELPNMEIQKKELSEFDIVDFKNIEESKKQSHEKTHTKKRGEQWVSIDDPDLSSRFRKKTVNRDLDDSSEKVGKKTRRAGRKRKGQTSSKNKKTATHKPAKGKKVIRGRAGNRAGKNKVKKRGKGRANRKTKK